MPYKICPYCNEASYSAAGDSAMGWLCPRCHRDIGHVQSRASLDDKRNKFADKPAKEA